MAFQVKVTEVAAKRRLIYFLNRVRIGHTVVIIERQVPIAVIAPIGSHRSRFAVRRRSGHGGQRDRLRSRR